MLVDLGLLQIVGSSNQRNIGTALHLLCTFIVSISSRQKLNVSDLVANVELQHKFENNLCEAFGMDTE